MMEWLEELDRSIFLALNGAHAAWLDTIMWYVSTTYIWIPLYLFFLWFAWRKRGWKFAGLLLLAVGISVAATDLISVRVFKNTVERYRPTHNTEIGHLVHVVPSPEGKINRGGKYGFVSSHAANMGGIAMLLFLCFRKYSRWWWMLFFWWALIAYSRIYLGVHYPGDVVCGGLVGALVGYLLFLSLKKLTAGKERV